MNRSIAQQKLNAHFLFVLALLLVVKLPAFAGESISLPYYGSAELTPHWLSIGDEALLDFHRIPAFSFVNQVGETVTEKTVSGEVYVASFFFSTCPGICPRIRSKLSDVQSRFINDDSVQILSHSIRPSTDTIDVLQEYGRANNVVPGKWHLLTGDQTATYELARDAYFANEDLGKVQSADDFLHTENLLLIDQNRHIRGVYNGLNTSSVAHLITDIESLLSNPPPALPACHGDTGEEETHQAMVRGVKR